MEKEISQEQKEIIYKTGYEFALEGLKWENYKPIFRGTNLFDEEIKIFSAGFIEGEKSLNNSIETEERIRAR